MIYEFELTLINNESKQDFNERLTNFISKYKDYIDTIQAIVFENKIIKDKNSKDKYEYKILHSYNIDIENTKSLETIYHCLQLGQHRFDIRFNELMNNQYNRLLINSIVNTNNLIIDTSLQFKDYKVDIKNVNIKHASNMLEGSYSIVDNLLDKNWIMYGEDDETKDKAIIVPPLYERSVSSLEQYKSEQSRSHKYWNHLPKYQFTADIEVYTPKEEYDMLYTKLIWFQDNPQGITNFNLSIINNISFVDNSMKGYY